MTSGAAIPIDPRQLPSVARAGYLVSLALLGPFLTPYIGIWDGVVPVGSLSWRFGFVGLLFSSLFYLMLALAIAGVTATYFGHRRILLGVMLVSAATALLVAVGLPLFALDTLQIRKTMTAAAFLAYKTAAMKGAALAAVAFVALVVTSLASYQTWRSLRGVPAPGERAARAKRTRQL